MIAIGNHVSLDKYQSESIGLIVRSIDGIPIIFTEDGRLIKDQIRNTVSIGCDECVVIRVEVYGHKEALP